MDDEAMKARPILFSGPMVRALLEGRKTQTRRIIKPQPMLEVREVSLTRDGMGVGGRYRLPDQCPYGQPGDLLWVPESYYLHDDMKGIAYAADNERLPQIGCYPQGVLKEKTSHPHTSEDEPPDARNNGRESGESAGYRRGGREGGRVGVDKSAGFGGRTVSRGYREHGIRDRLP